MDILDISSTPKKEKKNHRSFSNNIDEKLKSDDLTKNREYPPLLSSGNELRKMCHFDTQLPSRPNFEKKK